MNTTEHAAMICAEDLRIMRSKYRTTAEIKERLRHCIREMFQVRGIMFSNTDSAKLLDARATEYRRILNEMK